jgi:hypothetical protein
MVNVGYFDERWWEWRNRMKGCGSKSAGCRPVAVRGEKMTLAQMVAEYRRKHIALEISEAEFFRKMPSMELAIHHVALAIDVEGRCFDHQRLIQRSARLAAKRRLESAIADLKSCRSFDELHALVKKLLWDVYGIGELYVYDSAERLGKYLGLSPTRVYLHRGVRDGAKALGLNTRRGVLELDELPKALRLLSADHAENFLCIYKDRL